MAKRKMAVDSSGDGNGNIGGEGGCVKDGFG